MMSEDLRLIPGLVEAWIEPAQSEPIQYGERIIPESFTALFMFKDKSKTWNIDFSIRVTKGGTPLLTSLQALGSKFKDGERDSIQRWQLKVLEQYRYQLLELAVELAITTRWPTVMLRREFNAVNTSIVRAITQLGHKPNEMVLEHPSTIKGKLPSGEVADFVRFWNTNIEKVSGKELKKLQLDIGKSIRRRITDKFLKEVAGVYEQAVADGLDPIKHLITVYKCKSRTAQQWATMARAPQLGFLPPTKSGKVTVRKTNQTKGKDNGKRKKK
jgi:hypothetical protein